MNTRVWTVVVVIAWAVASMPAARAQAPSLCDVTECGDCCRDANGCHCACCREICCPKVEEVTEEKSCWIVNCEKKCVPAIRLPWEAGGSPLTLFNCFRNHGTSGSAGGPCGSGIEAGCCVECDSCPYTCTCAPVRCGTVRAVHVLDKKTYDATKCATKWEIKRVMASCGNCRHQQSSTAQCVDAACGSSLEASLSEPQ